MIKSSFDFILQIFLSVKSLEEEEDYFGSDLYLSMSSQLYLGNFWRKGFLQSRKMGIILK